jgi:hypothetical protein
MTAHYEKINNKKKVAACHRTFTPLSLHGGSNDTIGDPVQHWWPEIPPFSYSSGRIGLHLHYPMRLYTLNLYMWGEGV